MELTNDQQSTRPHADGSDEALSQTFREWAEAMTPEQIRYLLAACSAEHMADHLRRKHMPVPEDPVRVWCLLKAELVARLQMFNALYAKAGTA
jgi:hypothetical protein